jgi:uncharacterized protein (TIGR00156 family)
MKFLMLLLMLTLFTLNTQAQYTGPSTSANWQMSVSEVLENARLLQLRGTDVQLRGYVVQHIREDYFLFRDASGEMLIEIYGDVMPTWEFNDKTEILLTGEVDFDLLRGTYLWVERIQKAGQVTQ